VNSLPLSSPQKETNVPLTREEAGSTPHSGTSLRKDDHIVAENLKKLLTF